MTHEEAVARAVKLLRLAKSDNPNEAALAMARAQEIIDRFKLSQLGLNADSDTGEPVSEEPIKTFDAALDGEIGMKLSTWRQRLGIVVAEANQCRTHSSQGRTIIVGRPSDAETVRYLYAWLTREVDRLAARDARGNGRTWANNYRNGVVDTLRGRLRAQKKEMVDALKHEASAAIDASRALVRVDNALVRLERRGEAVEEWRAAHVYGLHTIKLGARARYDRSAREAGQRAGREINVGGAKRTLGSGSA